MSEKSDINVICVVKRLMLSLKNEIFVYAGKNTARLANFLPDEDGVFGQCFLVPVCL